MAGEIAAKRHAQAVFEIARDKSTLDQWRSDLHLMAAVFGDPELLPVLEDPRIRFEDKANAVEKSMPEISEMALNLARLLILRRRVRIMPQIAEEYGRLMDREQGIEHAEVTTAVEMDPDTEAKLKDRLAQLTGTQVVLSARINPDILGGFVARVGDKVIDGSVRNRLQNLKRRIAAQAG